MFKKSIFIFLRGMLMGAADLVPGVSGGTIAFITGIYARLIHSLGTIDFSFLKYLLQGKLRKSWGIFKKIDFALFIPLGLGISLAILLFSRVITYLIEVYPAITFGFFFGLILASAVMIYKKLHVITFETIIFLLLGFITAFIITGASSVTASHSLPIIFLAGALAISAMLLPGISGAFILLLIGQYQYLLAAIHSLNFVVIATFGLGAIASLLLFSKALDYLLRKFKAVTFSFLIGLMIGSLRIPFYEITSNGGINVYVFLLAIAGFLLVFILESLFHPKK